MSRPPTATLTSEAPLDRRAVTHVASWVFLGVLPVVTVVALFAVTIQDGTIAVDFRQFYAAARVILDGGSPYLGSAPLTAWGGPYPYPPLLAELATPSTALSRDAAGLIVMATLVAVALAVPFVLGVRDWRCYGILLLWPPVISAIQTGNVTLWLALACALVWRFRDRLFVPAASLGLAIAAKLFLWPFVLWLAATHRVAAAVASAVAGIGLLLASWAVIGFAGFLDYPNLLRRLDDAVGKDSYSTYVVGVDLGLPGGVARAAWLAMGFVVLCAALVVSRRGNEREGFVLVVGASLALTPIVWLHYFALLLVVVGLMQPRLGAAWFVPLGMVLTPGSGHHTLFEAGWTLGVAAATIALSLRASRGSATAEERPAPAPTQRSRPAPLATR